MIKNLKIKSRDREVRAQVTVFVIIAIVIIVGIALFFILRKGFAGPSLPKDLDPVYSNYLSCIEEEILFGAMVLGHQAGYIETPEFSPGSSYMPFSSHLDFLGTGVPYWYYISGNGIVREQVPSKEKMESQLNDFLEERILRCDLSRFADEGYQINLSRDISVKSSIEDDRIVIDFNQDVGISLGEVSWIGEKHFVDVESNLGNFYSLAKKIYLNNQESMFLENYGVDVLRLYAPVDGNELGCSTKIWITGRVRENLTRALEANVPHIKVKGDYYELKNPENKYFVRDIGEDVSVNVNFMYLREWPMKMEIWPSEDGILRADPVGLQEGLGMLGFCYVPYHFVYDLGYPVLIQLFYGTELFQFPVVVFIDKNKPREAEDVEGFPNVVPELCQHKSARASVHVYNTNLEPIFADVKFKCFDTTCGIGRTDPRDGSLTAYFPQCVNGYVVASSPGYRTKKQLIPRVEGEIVIVLEKEYELGLEVMVSGRSSDYSVVTFSKNDDIVTVSYPDQKEIKLTEGQYEIKAYSYTESNLMLEGSSTQKCIDVPKAGVLGALGMTEEKCFDFDIPSQEVGFAVTGGGKQNYYIAESELRDSDKLVIEVTSFGVPQKLEDLQINYNEIEMSGLRVRFE